MSRYEDLDQYEALIRTRLSKKRFNHSMNVAEECYKLAERYGADKKRCYLAGLLHDIMKEEEHGTQRRLAAESGLSPDPAEIDTPSLWHAIAGAAYVRDTLAIDDSDIVLAIRYHTVGCAKMTLMEKIVYLGDMVSADRSYKDVDKLRKICYDDIDKALAMALAYQLKSVAGKCGNIPLSTFEAYNYYLKYNKTKENI